MVLRFAAKAAWFTAKVTVKYVVVPLAVIAVGTAASEKLTQTIEESTPGKNGEAATGQPKAKAKPKPAAKKAPAKK